MSLKTHQIVLQTDDHADAGTSCEVWVRFAGTKAKTEWLLFADHREADLRAEFRPGGIIHAHVPLPDLGQVMTCGLVLRGAKQDDWYPRSVELLGETVSYFWSLSGPLRVDKPVALGMPAVSTARVLPAKECSRPSEALERAESLMIGFQADWVDGSSGAATPRQALTQIIDVLRDSDLLSDSSARSDT